jgi:hypothetical protein
MTLQVGILTLSPEYGAKLLVNVRKPKKSREAIRLNE